MKKVCGFFLIDLNSAYAVAKFELVKYAVEQNGQQDQLWHYRHSN